MTIYRGLGGVNREIKQQFRGVSGVNREIKEQYRGVGGVNRKVFSSWNGEIYNAGNEYASITGGWRPSSNNNLGGGFAKNADNVLQVQSSPSGNNSCVVLITTNSISFTGYTKLNVQITDAYSSAGGTGYAGQFGVYSDANPTFTALDSGNINKTNINNGTTGTLSFPLTNCGNTGYIYIGTNDANAIDYTRRIKISKIWLS